MQVVVFLQDGSRWVNYDSLGAIAYNARPLDLWDNLRFDAHGGLVW